MNYVFEQQPWDALLAEMNENQTLSALQLLHLLESADEEETEQFLDALAQKQITIDVSTLPKVSGNDASARRLQQEEKMVQQGNLPQGLGENDPLRLYLQEIADVGAQLPVKTPVTPEEKQEFTDAMLGETARLAQAYVGMGVLLLDLIQEANLGLWQGIQSYKEGNLVGHCNWWSNHYLSRAVLLQAKASGIGQKLRQTMQDYRTVDEQLLTELGRNPTTEEIAEALHVSISETQAAAQMLDSARLINRVKPPTSEPLCQEEDQAVEDTAYFQMRQRILELLSILPQEDARLLTLRYGLEGGIPMKPEQVARELGITAREVAERESAALTKLRTKN